MPGKENTGLTEERVREIVREELSAASRRARDEAVACLDEMMEMLEMPPSRIIGKEGAAES